MRRKSDTENWRKVIGDHYNNQNHKLNNDCTKFLLKSSLDFTRTTFGPVLAFLLLMNIAINAQNCIEDSIDECSLNTDSSDDMISDAFDGSAESTDYSSGNMVADTFDDFVTSHNSTLLTETSMPISATPAEIQTHMQPLLSITPIEKQPSNAMKSPKFFSGPYNEYFKSQADAEIPVNIHPTYEDLINVLKAIEPVTAQGEQYERQAKNLCQQIKEKLPKLPIHPQILDRLTQTNFTIHIVAASVMDHSKAGRNGLLSGYYQPTTNDLLLRARDFDDGALTSCLLNGMHHAAVTTRNFQRLQQKIPQGSQAAVQMPQLDEYGNISPQRTKKLMTAHDQFKKNVKKFIDWHYQKASKKISHTDQAFFEEIKKAIIQFHLPSTLPFRLNPNDYNKARQLGYVKLYPDGTERLSKAIVPSAKYDLHIYPGSFFTYSHPNEPASTIVAFIDEFENTEQQYSEKSPENQLLEYSSYIDSLTPELKQRLAPLWCKYFSEFHEVDYYCRLSS